MKSMELYQTDAVTSTNRLHQVRSLVDLLHGELIEWSKQPGNSQLLFMMFQISPAHE